MAIKLFNLARMTTATTGTGTVTLGTAVSGYLTFASAGVANGDIVFYGIKDGANSELGIGQYTSAGTTLTRVGVFKSTTGGLITLSGSAEVYLPVIASDGGDLIPGFTNPLRGFDTPINLQLNASVAANALTITVTGNNGAAPSNSNPILIPFRDPTAANGGPVWRFINTALSMTLPNGAPMGAANGVPFRLWIVAIDNGGTVVLGAFQSVTGGAAPTAIAPLNEAAPANTTLTASAGVVYTPGATLTSKPIRIIGYVDYASGLATAGAYATTPTTVQLFGPGIRKPGEIVQVAIGVTTSPTTVTSAAYSNTALSVAIAPSSAPNLMLVEANSGGLNSPTSTNYAMVAIFRGSTQLGCPGVSRVDGSVTNALSSGVAVALDAPGTTSSTTYVLKLRNSDGASGVGTGINGDVGGNRGLIKAQEIMV